MALLEKDVEVKPSTLPGAGKGLFTTIFIPKGSRIIEYKGRITTWEEVQHEWNNFYLYILKPDHVIDARNQPKMLARYVNDARGLNRIKGLDNNAEFVNDGLRVFISATRDIQPGEEILVGYGHAYWETVRKNKKNGKGKG